MYDQIWKKYPIQICNLLAQIEQVFMHLEMLNFLFYGICTLCIVWMFYLFIYFGNTFHGLGKIIFYGYHINKYI